MPTGGERTWCSGVGLVLGEEEGANGREMMRSMAWVEC